MIVVGSVLLLLAMGVAAVTADLLMENGILGIVDLGLIGRSVAVMPARTQMILAAAGGAVSMLLLALAVAAFTSAKRRARRRAVEEIATRNAGLEARNRLLESRTAELTGKVEALERRREQAAGELNEVERTLESRRAAARAVERNRLIVLPELSPAEESGSER